MECSGFYLGIQPDDITLGAGRHGFEKESLDRYRAAVVDATLGRELQHANERADLLLHNGLHVGKTFEDPPELHTPGFVDFCLGHYTAIAPVHRWLLRATQAASGT
jgi:hypothetical protein